MEANGKAQPWSVVPEAPPWISSFSSLQIHPNSHREALQIPSKAGLLEQEFKRTQKMPVIKHVRYVKQEIEKEPGESQDILNRDGINNRVDIAEELSMNSKVNL